MFDVSVMILQSGHGSPFYSNAQQDTFPITVFCLAAAAIVAGLWLLAEILD